MLEQKFRFGAQYSDGPFGLGESTTLLVNDSISNNEQHLALAEESATESAVLLYNGPSDAPVLPIRGASSIALVGLDVSARVSAWTTPPVTGAVLHLTSDVNLGDRGPSKVENDPATSVGPLAGIQAVAASHGVRAVTSGNHVAAADGADFIVLVVGLTAANEGEENSTATPVRGDRSSLDLSSEQTQLVDDV